MHKTIIVEGEIIQSEIVDQRIDKALSGKWGTRNQIVHMISAGLITVNEKTVKASYSVKAGDVIVCHLPEEKIDTELTPYDLKLDILFEDKDILVLDKPSGLVVHPAPGHRDKTLVNALIAHTKDLSIKNETRPGIVHRIDKETSGILIVAKNDFSHENLVEQFRSRSIERVYQALVWGKLSPVNGRVESILARHPTDRKRFSSTKNISIGKHAITNYKTLKYKSGADISLVECKLETGRTHQIRVHLSEAGNPIVGDLLYGATKQAKRCGSKEVVTELSYHNRFFLHAMYLGVIHPVTKQRLEFTRPWPQPLQPLFKLLDFGSEAKSTELRTKKD